MPTLADRLKRLAAGAAQARPHAHVHAHGTRLTPLADFGANPGALLGWMHVPANLPAGAPLVVVLHGCTQTAADYDRGSGWSQLADRHGFAVLFPEQQRANNPNLCFNWFVAEDNLRDTGEPRSIRSMIERMIADHRLDRARIFVTGLSAGGAMTSVMLATHPDLFAGGAIIAGLPYGTARGVPEALGRMRGRGADTPDQLAASVRDASRHTGPWPKIAIWHGTADHTVSISNADAIVDQWRGLHAVPAAPQRQEVIDGHPYRAWSDAAGQVKIEEYRVTGMGHGTPIDPGAADGCGAAGPHMLAVGISSTRRIAASWGIAPAVGSAVTATATADRVVPKPMPMAPARPRSSARPAPRPVEAPARAAGVGKVIEDALRAAGLMR